MTPPATKKRLPTGSVRIIGGRWKRTPLPVVDAPGLRPTPDRVRETVFNWLVHTLGGLDGRSALDLFAGTGALGLEAASRGAGGVVLVENHPAALDRLRTIAAKLGADAEIRAGDARTVAKRLLAEGRRFDIVFLDPPFDQGLLPAAMALAAALCTATGLIYVESDAVVPGEAAAAVGFDVVRADRAGDVFYHLLQRKKQDEET